MEAFDRNGALPRRGNGSAVRGTERGTFRRSEFARTKPEGGFCFVPAMALIATWWAYKRAIVSLADVRVWLAIFEVVARRCGDRVSRSFFGVEHEIAALVMMSPEHVATSLRRLERTGFLRRNRTAFQPCVDVDRLSIEEREDLLSTVRQVANHRRKVPVPRRLLRLLCGVKRPVFWATTVGHLLRCMYYRNGQCAPDGRCKSSWIAKVFEVDGRNVKSARRELVARGVLIMDSTDQWSMNRWGPRVRFNLVWGVPVCIDRPPPPAANLPRKLPPPRKDRELVSRMVNQEPAGGALASRIARTWHVEVDELRSPRRLQALYERSARLRLCRPDDAARLAFFATAARALRVASTNPAGFFAALVRSGHWEYATLADEDAARRWIRQLTASEAVQWLDSSTGDSVAAVVTASGAPESVAAVLGRVLPGTFGISAARPVGGEEGRRGSPRGKLGTMVPLRSSEDVRRHFARVSRRSSDGPDDRFGFEDARSIGDQIPAPDWTPPG